MKKDYYRLLEKCRIKKCKEEKAMIEKIKCYKSVKYIKMLRNNSYYNLQH